MEPLTDLPADAVPAAPPPTPPPTLPPRSRVDNPFVKGIWTERDLFVALVMIQTSSGRKGEEAVRYAIATMTSMNEVLDRMDAEKVASAGRLVTDPPKPGT